MVMGGMTGEESEATEAVSGASLIVVATGGVTGDFLRRFFSMPRGRKRLAVLATGFR